METPWLPNKWCQPVQLASLPSATPRLLYQNHHGLLAPPGDVWENDTDLTNTPRLQDLAEKVERVQRLGTKLWVAQRVGRPQEELRALWRQAVPLCRYMDGHVTRLQADITARRCELAGTRRTVTSWIVVTAGSALLCGMLVRRGSYNCARAATAMATVVCGAVVSCYYSRTAHLWQQLDMAEELISLYRRLRWDAVPSV